MRPRPARVLAWLAYPGSRQLGTDLNRDSLAALVTARGARPVRSISIDGVWSAIRFRPALAAGQVKLAPGRNSD